MDHGPVHSLSMPGLSEPGSVLAFRNPWAMVSPPAGWELDGGMKCQRWQAAGELPPLLGRAPCSWPSHPSLALGSAAGLGAPCGQRL